jgi:transposase
VGGRR